jgi:uncharacterized protein YvpB
MPTFTLKTLQEMNLKRRPIPGADLPDDQKQPLPAGKDYPLTSWAQERDHVRLAFAQEKFKGFNTWYAFGDSVQVFQDGKQVWPRAIPGVVDLKIAYRSQLDNEENPTGSCNVTSIAMALDFLGISRKTISGQFEDELYRYTLDNGLSRHDPNDLVRVVEAYGGHDNFRQDASIEDVKAWLAAGKPIVIHGYFTSFGHIIVARGYDQNGFIVNDPYGEWTPSGYRTDLSGDGINYSYSMIKRLCIPDGHFWVHFISK